MNLPFYTDTETIDSAAHLIQVALTPVFMLSGIGTLINIFNTRLTRVSDRLEDVNKRLANFHNPNYEDRDDLFYTPTRLRIRQARLRWRIFTLDIAIILNGMGGAFTCCAAIALFIGSLRDSSTSTWLLTLFGAALSCTIAALMAFLADTIISWHGLRRDRKDCLIEEEARSHEANSS